MPKTRNSVINQSSDNKLPNIPNRKALEKLTQELDNPQNATQWIFALNFPESMAFKILDAALTKVEFKLLLEHYLRIIAFEKQLEKKNERVQLIASLYAAEVLSQQHYREALIKIEQMEAKQLTRLTEKSYQDQIKLIQDLPTKIISLQQEIKQLEKEADGLNTQIASHSHAIRKNQTLITNELIAMINKGEIKVHLSHGDSIKTLEPKEVEKILQDAPKQEPIHEMLEHNTHLKDQLVTLWKDGQDPSAALAAKHAMLDQILKCSAFCPEGASSSDILKFIKINKALNKKMGELSAGKLQANAKNLHDLLNLTHQYMEIKPSIDMKTKEVELLNKQLKVALASMEKMDAKPKA